VLSVPIDHLPEVIPDFSTGQVRVDVEMAFPFQFGADFVESSGLFCQLKRSLDRVCWLVHR